MIGLRWFVMLGVFYSACLATPANAAAQTLDESLERMRQQQRQFEQQLEERRDIAARWAILHYVAIITWAVLLLLAVVTIDSRLSRIRKQIAAAPLAEMLAEMTRTREAIEMLAAKVKSPKPAPPPAAPPRRQP